MAIFDQPINPVKAREVAPAHIVPCTETSEDIIRGHLASAVQVTTQVQYRLATLAGKSPAEREKAWNSGPENDWLLAYNDRKFDSLNSTFSEVAKILADRRLRVVCDPKFPKYGGALPGIRRIKLGQLWLTEAKRDERVQAIIHEATHIAGRWVANEKKWYGREDAKTEAKNTQANHPMRVMSSADNLGYYAIDVSVQFTTLMWQ